jgi:hypothetical protein
VGHPYHQRGSEKKERIQVSYQQLTCKRLCLKNNGQPFCLKIYVVGFVNEYVGADLLQECARGGIFEALVKNLCRAFNGNDRYEEKISSKEVTHHHSCVNENG